MNSASFCLKVTSFLLMEYGKGKKQNTVSAAVKSTKPEINNCL